MNLKLTFKILLVIKIHFILTIHVSRLLASEVIYWLLFFLNISLPPVIIRTLWRRNWLLGKQDKEIQASAFLKSYMSKKSIYLHFIYLSQSFLSGNGSGIFHEHMLVVSYNCGLTLQPIWKNWKPTGWIQIQYVCMISWCKNTCKNAGAWNISLLNFTLIIITYTMESKQLHFCYKFIIYVCSAHKIRNKL